MTPKPGIPLIDVELLARAMERRDLWMVNDDGSIAIDAANLVAEYERLAALPVEEGKR